MANIGSLVVVETEVSAQFNFTKSTKIESEIDRRVVSGIAAHDD